ncbi:MAG: hypothetical protein KA821_17635 [Chitinophagaceae bacterium]|nr:hypothetical protein [Chitinophagaceae bacterium]
MHLENQLLKEHSRANCMKIVQWVGSSQERFDELFTLFTTGTERVIQRSAWPLSYAVQQHPKLIKPHLTALIRQMEKDDLPPAVRRNAVRLLQEVDVPVRLQGKLMNCCFDYICDPQEKAAVKAFSLTILERMSRQYPDIAGELRRIIEERWDQETAAFRSRGRKILARLP